jgi:hypothetical protein
MNTNSGEWANVGSELMGWDGQLELPTVIDHKLVSVLRDVNVSASNSTTPLDLHKPSGVRLAKMLAQYDDQPSSQLWSDIQRLAREILK